MVDARSLFPDIFSRDKTEQADTASPPSLPPAENHQNQLSVPPPPPPDISWLRTSADENLENGEIADIPSALVLTPLKSIAESLIEVFSNIGYQTETAENVVEALHKILSLNYAVVVLDVTFEKEKPFTSSSVHAYINQLPMSRRRLIYYILIGPDFHTLYNLEALNNSANLVINSSNINHFESIFRKGIKDYEELIAPLLQSLENRGKYR